MLRFPTHAFFFATLCTAGLFHFETLNGAEEPPLAEVSIEDLAATAQQSLVVIEGTGRADQRRGEGSGFAISTDLIATARHVVGEGRRISVVLPDQRTIPVLEVHSQMAHLDMVVLRTEPHGLPPLDLSDQSVVVGTRVVALGHPHGLRNSVVSGIVSGRRDIENISMLQLAMAIEPGNSGGPVVGMDGKVLGMVTLKSTATDNIGFAIPVVHLQRLIDIPNPIAMDRWVTIGALDQELWEVMGGATWRQRAGRVLVEGQGTGFGGRTLCVRKEIPDLPLEVEVDVLLDDEAGAAGLVIHSDGGDRHYGFYPSNGKLRFTRFNGPDVYSWTILHNEPHSAYRLNQWNTLKVRVDTDSMSCYVNGEPVFATTDRELRVGRSGLAAFRGTEASFRNFAMGSEIPSRQPTPEQQRRIAELLERVHSVNAVPYQLVNELSPFGDTARSVLESTATDLEMRATLLRQLADDVHTIRVLQSIQQLLDDPQRSTDHSGSTSLLGAALMLARLDNDEVQPETYVKKVDRMADDIRSELDESPDELQRLKALDDWLFNKNGFRGSQQQYYTQSNSYLNEVIDDREGLPIALSVLYIELATRLDLTVEGIGLPGHFIVRFVPQDESNEPQWIDVFNRGQRLTEQDLERLVRDRGLRLDQRFLEPQSPRQIVERMLRNLLGLAEHERDDRSVLRYLELLVGLVGDNPEYRAKRLEIRARTGHPKAALEDANWFLKNQPQGVSLDQLQKLKSELESRVSGQ